MFDAIFLHKFSCDAARKFVRSLSNYSPKSPYSELFLILFTTNYSKIYSSIMYACLMGIYQEVAVKKHWWSACKSSAYLQLGQTFLLAVINHLPQCMPTINKHLRTVSETWHMCVWGWATCIIVLPTCMAMGLTYSCSAEPKELELNIGLICSCSAEPWELLHFFSWTQGAIQKVKEANFMYENLKKLIFIPYSYLS